ncbi:unnamed protein product [Kluyveromyces dobzhanskii CBS 2104]|uniref:glutaminase n=1 Tax=Kluyveromyces dobzhanskii CBS 2104 TaxID=1427455 RepID=A0A0A8L0B3_9SACH|nr:unnamed protein product [Kluyveromyces dobzhanskii CBS 2104]
MTKKIGVLALQGAFIEHVTLLKRAIDKHNYDVSVTTVKTASQLAECDSLVIPGGESTTISLIAKRTGLLQPLLDFVHDPSKTVWGTCAGLIFLAEKLSNESKFVDSLDLLKVRVRRNAFGRQAESFIQTCDFSSFIPGCTDFQVFFIRAPIIENVLSNDVEVLFALDDGSIVAVSQQGRILGTSFHPELSDNDIRFHDWFIQKYVLGL